MSRREPVMKYKYVISMGTLICSCNVAVCHEFVHLSACCAPVPGLKNRCHSFCDGRVLVWQASATCSKKTELFNSGSLLSTAITRLKVFGCSCYRNCTELSGCTGYFRACNLLKQNSVWPIHPFHAAVSGLQKPLCNIHPWLWEEELPVHLCGSCGLCLLEEVPISIPVPPCN